MGGLDYHMGCLNHEEKGKVTKHPQVKFSGITCTRNWNDVMLFLGILLVYYY